MAKYVAAFLDLETWEQRTFIVGDKVTMNEMVKIAEEATGMLFVHEKLRYRKLILV